MSAERIDIFREIVIVLTLALVMVSSLSIKAVNAQAGQVTLQPTDNTFVDSLNPKANYGGGTYSLSIENCRYIIPNYQYIQEFIVWLKFDLSSVPSGAIIDEATLQLYNIMLLGGGPFNISAYSCSDNSWTEMTITYSNMPSYNVTSMNTATLANEAASQWYYWSVVDAVRNALDSHSNAVTIVLREPSPNTSMGPISFETKEAAAITHIDYAPQLNIQWSEVVPEFPTLLVLPSFMIATLIAVSLSARAIHVRKETITL